MKFYKYSDIKKNNDFDIKDYFVKEVYFTIKDKTIYLEKTGVDLLFPNLDIDFYKLEDNIYKSSSVKDFKKIINDLKIEENRIKSLIVKEKHRTLKDYLSEIDTALCKYKRICSIDCEFNKEDITEIGIIIIDLNNNSYENYHYILEKKEACHDNSPFGVKNKNSLSEINFFKTMDDKRSEINKILSSVDVVIGHNIESDKRQIIKSDIFNFKNIYFIDTQRILYKKNKEIFSLKNALLTEKINVSDYVSENITKKFQKLRKNYTGLNYVQFFEEYNYNNVSLHNGYNDAFLTMLLFNSIAEDYCNITIINEDLKKKLANYSKKCYDNNFDLLIKEIENKKPRKIRNTK